MGPCAASKVRIILYLYYGFFLVWCPGAGLGLLWGLGRALGAMGRGGAALRSAKASRVQDLLEPLE